VKESGLILLQAVPKNIKIKELEKNILEVSSNFSFLMIFNFAY
jgi:hypothetical protein